MADPSLDASTESHTGTTGSVSEASFSWTHAGGVSPKGAGVAVYGRGADDYAGTVTYDAVTLSAVTDGQAIDTAGEPMRCKLYYRGDSIPGGNQTVTVNRTNNSNVLWGVSFTVNADGDTELVGTPVLLQEDGTLAEQSIDSGAAVAIRFAALFSGFDAPPTVGASSTLLQSIDFSSGAYSAVFARETTAGAGARSVGFSSGTTDDRAGVHFGIKQVAAAGDPEGSLLGGKLLRGGLLTHGVLVR